MSSVQPIGDRVLIERLEAETKTPGGIIIPDSAKEKPVEGKVVAVGSGSFVDGKRQPMEVKVGDIVIFTKWGGTEIKDAGKEYLLVKESDILAIKK